MFKRIIITVWLLFFTILSIFSFSLYMPNDPQIAELISLYSRAGIIFPDASYPLSLADLADYASRLHNKINKKEITNNLKTYIENLDFMKGKIVTDNSYNLKTAFFFNNNRYIPNIDSNLEHTRYPNNFYNRFVQFPDMIYFALSAAAQGESGIHIAAGLKREFNSEEIVNTNIFLSTSDDPAKFENYFVRKGYLAWKIGSFEFRFGRTPVHYGDARFSTFLPSNKLPWLDTFTYRYKVGPLTMTSFFGTIDSRITDDEKKLFTGDNSKELFSDDGKVTFDDTNKTISLKVDDEPTNFSFQNTIILNSMHRFILGWEKLRIGFSSYIIVARENNAIQIGDIFPVFSWHNAAIGSNNMNLVFDVGYIPLPRMALYAQLAWDDINASNLFGIPDTSIPTIPAYLLGVSYIPKWISKLDLSMKMETGITHYLWGNYYAYNNSKGSYFSRAIYRYQAQKGEFWMPLTSPYGPATWWVKGESIIELTESINFTAGFTYLKFNSNVNLFTTAYSNDTSLKYYNSTSFSVYVESQYTYKLSNNSNLQFKLIPSWYSYKGHEWPEFKISIKLSGRKTKNF